jgi:hypothetical protein
MVPEIMPIAAVGCQAHSGHGDHLLDSCAVAKGKPPNAVREYLRDLGRRGGKAAAGAGVKARYAAMTKEERRELARKAARARWNKAKNK